MSETDKRWMVRVKRWAVLFGIPWLMLAMGIWQWSRADAPIGVNAQDVSATIAEYKEVVQELEAIQAKTPGRAMIKDRNGREQPVWKLKSEYLQAIQALESQSLSVTTRKLQPMLAACTIAFGVLALLWSALGVFYQRGMGKKALQSREQLLVTFQKGRKLLPAYMVVMVLLLFAAAIPLVVYEMMPILRHNRYSRGDVKFMFLLGCLALLLFYSGCKVLWDVWKASRKPMENEPIGVMGQTLTPEQAPELWAFVARVASKINAGMPDSIVVGLNEGFFVTEHPVQLASGTMVPQGRVLYLPLPYMAFLNAGEVAAVIGHELGHFIGEDTLYSQRFSPIYSATINHLVAISGGEQQAPSGLDILRRPATLLGEMFLDSFHEAVRFWSRKRELAADAVGASVVNPQAVASSLLRITALEPHVSEALQANWDRGETVEGGVLGHVRQLVASKGMVDPSQHLENRQSHPTDTHPELAVRLDALGVVITPTLLDRAMDAQGSHLLQEFGLEQGEGSVTGSTLAPASVVDVNTALQSELTSVAASNRSAKVAELQAMAAVGREQAVIYERTWMQTAWLTFFAVLCAAIAAILWRSKGNMPFIVATSVVALACAWMAYVFSRDSKEPALVLMRDGLQLFKAQELLSWQAIEDFEFLEINYTLRITMPLKQGVVPPAMGVGKRRGQYQKKKQRLVLALKGVKKMKNEAFIGLLVDYWHAYHACQELRRMGVQV